jgi:hypothetical protein
MTRAELVKFLEQEYEPDEQLVWQTIRYDDVANGVERATPDNWVEFIENQEYYGELADEISELVFNAFYEFVENLYRREED